MPPIHPAIVHFPIALAIFGVIVDLLGDGLRSPSLRSVGNCSMAGATMGAAAAVASGYYDMNRATFSPELDGYVHLHSRIGWLVLGVLALLTAWRWLAGNTFRGGHHVAFRLATVLAVALVVLQGWYGGEMVYVHGASVAATGQGVERYDKAKERLHTVYELLGAPRGGSHGAQGAADAPHR